MAKDKELDKLNSENIDDDFDDLGDFDDFGDFGDFELDDIDTSKRKPIEDFKDNFVSDLKKSTLKFENIYKTGTKEINKRFSETSAVFDTISESTNVLRDLKNDISKELAPSVNVLRTVTKKSPIVRTENI